MNVRSSTLMYRIEKGLEQRIRGGGAALLVWCLNCPRMNERPRNVGTGITSLTCINSDEKNHEAETLCTMRKRNVGSVIPQLDKKEKANFAQT